MQWKLANLFSSIPPPPPPSKKKRTRSKSPAGNQSSKPKPAPLPKQPKKRKQHIPLALREQVWLKQMGKVFHGKCPTTWCQNTITVYDFQSGHDIPESKGGPTTLENLIPLCSRCNNSMGNGYTFKEWCALSPQEEAKQTVPEVAPSSSSLRSSWCC